MLITTVLRIFPLIFRKVDTSDIQRQYNEGWLITLKAYTEMAHDFVREQHIKSKLFQYQSIVRVFVHYIKQGRAGTS